MGTNGRPSELVREHIPQFDFQLVQNRFQLVERQMVFSPLDAVQCGVGNAHFFCERGIRKPPPRRPQKLGKLAIQMSLHGPRLAELLSRMRDDFRLQLNAALLPRSIMKNRHRGATSKFVRSATPKPYKRRAPKQRKLGPDDVDPRKYLRDLENLPERERYKIKYGSERAPEQPCQ